MRNHMKQIVLLLLRIVIVFGICIVSFRYVLRVPVMITSEPIEITEDGYYPANYKQNEAKVILSVTDGKLFFFPRQFPAVDYRTKFDRYLSVFDDGTVRRIARFHHMRYSDVITMANGYVYYTKPALQHMTHIYSYHLLSGEESYLTTVPTLGEQYFLEDGTLFLAVDRDASGYYAIEGDVLRGQTSRRESYVLNGNTYTVEEYHGMEEIVRYDKNGNPEILRDFIPYGHKSLIPCKEGLLIHNEWAGDLLYFIHGDSEEIIELYSVECVASISAVNVHNGYVYLSYKRYEKHGEFGMVRYKNDDQKGTYRIRISDGSVEKLSDKVYSALYIFDDTGIYACDDFCNTYKLDFDGNVVMILLEQKMD